MRSYAGPLEGFDNATNKYKEMLKELMNSTKWVCTNGKDPKSLSNQEYVREFAQGSCNPAIVVPGIAGSKLIVEIDCKTFKDNNPAAFKSCGWSSCTGFLTPKSEYRMWIPGELAPMSIATGLDGNRKCFNAVMGFDSSEVMQGGKLTQRKGLKVVVEGTSPGTKTKATGKCAWEAISNLGLGGKADETKGFAGFLTFLENAGYKNGVNIQALPYNWRLDFKENDLKTRFAKVITEMYNNLGKKLVIYAHSFGNYQTVLNLSKMSQQDKDKMVARYMALGPPFLGAVQTLRMVFGLDNSFSQDVGFLKLGITGSMFKETIALLKGFYNLMPKDAFRRLKDRPFMQGIQARIDAEKHGYNIITNTVVDLLPGPMESCVLGFSTRDEFCKFGLLDMTTSGYILDTPINHDTVEDLLEQYGVIDGAKEIYNSVKNELFEVITNPGVQTNLVFTSTTHTTYQFTFDENPRLKTSKDVYVAPTFEKTAYGDGQVLTTSAVTAALKWADDFEAKQPGAKPVNIIEMCSVWNRRESVFEPGTKSVQKSAYFGYECGCGGTPHSPSDGKDCDHVSFIGDPKFYHFMLNSAMDGVAQVQSPTTEAFENQSNEWLANYENNCLLIMNND